MRLYPPTKYIGQVRQGLISYPTYLVALIVLILPRYAPNGPRVPTKSKQGVNHLILLVGRRER